MAKGENAPNASVCGKGLIALQAQVTMRVMIEQRISQIKCFPIWFHNYYHSINRGLCNCKIITSIQ